ncbi:DUF402 domain-containing protein [Pradoshia sp.]
MLKRKYGERPNWTRILQRKNAQTFLETDEFTGYITLLQMNQLTEPLIVHYAQRDVCIADEGYLWLQQFPADQHHSVTTMFNAEGNIVQWYIDICHRNGWEDRKPWWDDLYVDIILFPSGEMLVQDADEFENAYLTGVIDRELYELAWNEVRVIKSLIHKEEFALVNLAGYHQDLLLGFLK